MKFTSTEVCSVGTFLPTQVVKSDDLFSEIDSEVRYNIPINWMSDVMGIVERRMADDAAYPSDLAIPAAEKALSKCSISPDVIDMTIFCGIERDQAEPATAHTIQHKLGINAKHCFDIANACFGFFDAVEIASNFIKAGSIRYALIATGEVPTKVLKNCVSLLKKGVSVKEARNYIGALSVGDAGGAVIIGPAKNSLSGFHRFNTSIDSSHINKCIYRTKHDGSYEGQMLMGPISNAILNGHKHLIADTLKKLSWDHFDWMLTHQMGRRPFERLTEISRVAPSRMIKTYDKLGNITTATFPVGFEQLIENKEWKNGDRVGGCFAGSGITIGQFGYTI